jgi:hypothetical protein
LILVISNVANEAATELVGMFPSGAASLVTASNFNRSFKAGISVGDFSPSEITVGGAKTSAGRIRGVVSTIPYFLPQEFYYIEPADREYVCAEMSAFFIYFLSELRCRKLNPPSARRLSGLGMHRVEWAKVARGCGVPVLPFRLKNGTPTAPEGAEGLQYHWCTIIGGDIVGDRAPGLVGGYMRSLSQALAVPYLSCLFVSLRGNDHFLAELMSVPDVTIPENREAIVRFLQQPP